MERMMRMVEEKLQTTTWLRQMRMTRTGTGVEDAPLGHHLQMPKGQRASEEPHSRKIRTYWQTTDSSPNMTSISKSRPPRILREAQPTWLTTSCRSRPQRAHDPRHPGRRPCHHPLRSRTSLHQTHAEHTSPRKRPWTADRKTKHHGRHHLSRVGAGQSRAPRRCKWCPVPPLETPRR
jgi:hypothetical protein